MGLSENMWLAGIQWRHSMMQHVKWLYGKKVSHRQNGVRICAGANGFTKGVPAVVHVPLQNSKYFWTAEHKIDKSNGLLSATILYGRVI